MINNIFKDNLLFKDGKFIALFTILFAILAFISFNPLLILVIGFFLFSLYFFRNPNRVCSEYKQDNSILICPADGKIVDVSQGDFEGYKQKISIFLSPLDVHVNWLPMSGSIKEINYRPGKFIVAFAPKSSDINERNDIIIENQNGTILVRQIAGFVARRICCWIKTNDTVIAGQKYGMIRFGSRVDILLPKNVEIVLSIGDRVEGGKTILGRWL
jgi:phosphatidylserine decarboxylase